MKADKVIVDLINTEYVICATTFKNHTDDLERANVHETPKVNTFCVWFHIMLPLQNSSLANVIY